jgi:hypothetical protein
MKQTVYEFHKSMNFNLIKCSRKHLTGAKLNTSIHIILLFCPNDRLYTRPLEVIQHWDGIIRISITWREDIWQKFSRKVISGPIIKYKTMPLMLFYRKNLCAICFNDWNAIILRNTGLYYNILILCV